ncbi:hypothetical protein EYF80_051748 [Liparis tanakae]|uniref:Uncharacterized protein n=1 Tax=Liparis tanakae TaxID=230148 RepID=A0A4Z2FB09_9TELE|nr:hypothetical protein EYF80_051748 [Liparis tanakae]
MGGGGGGWSEEEGGGCVARTHAHRRLQAAGANTKQGRGSGRSRPSPHLHLPFILPQCPVSLQVTPTLHGAALAAWIGYRRPPHVLHVDRISLEARPVLLPPLAAPLSETFFGSVLSLVPESGG